jgi:hypothetical protein
VELSLLRSRKGIFFTLIAISLLGLVLFSYSVTYSYSMVEKSSAIEARVDTMNRFLGEVDTDMGNAIYIAGFRALIGMEDYIANTGTFVNSTSYAFSTLFMNGTIAGQNSSVMENNTFPYWIDLINGQANRVGINLSLNVSQVSIYQTSPWSVRVQVNSTLVISDSKSTANWTQDKSIYADIDVVGFEDPWYAVYTGNNIVKRINSTIYEGNFTNAATNTTNIRDHVSNTFYANFTGAPSFLMRFEDNFAQSEFGIESFVEKSEISPYHACPTETSSIDSIYWQCNSSVVVKQVSNWSSFRIDNESAMDNVTRRIGRYMLTNYTIG